MTERQHLTWTQKEAFRDRMGLSERGGEIFAVAVIALVGSFFYAHQAWSTGFFTTSFGPTEAFFLYGSIIAGGAGPVSRFITGRRNVSRIPELGASALWIAGSIWLLAVFPFNFAHLPDVLPDSLKFLLSWITNDVAWVLFVLGILGGIGSVPVNVVLYRRVRRLLFPDKYDLR
ncbi:MAG TPA: hypothetical protein VD736_00885 [Nitrososphaera sp.]|nr:hypothetical protein [Nitrososphaera sp.]